MVIYKTGIPLEYKRVVTAYVLDAGLGKSHVDGTMQVLVQVKCSVKKLITTTVLK